MGLIKRAAGFLKDCRKQVSAAHEYSGKPKPVIACDMAGCFIKRGVWPDQYRHMGFAKLNAEQRSGHLTNRVERRIEKALCDQKHYGPVFRNKYCFYRIYKEFFKRPCFRSSSVTPRQIEILFGDNDRFIYKPMEGKGGGGVKIFTKEKLYAEGEDKALRLLRGLPEGVLERMIPQHEALSELYPDAVNPVRVVTVYKNGKCRLVYGTLTLGLDKQYANASSGAIFALIDVKTGEVITDAVDYEHNRCPVHPVTGKTIKGFVIPTWDEVRKMLRRAAAVMPEMGLISWDIAVTPSGPVLIEGNNKGGYYGYQFYEFAEDGADTETAKLFKPYLK